MRITTPCQVCVTLFVTFMVMDASHLTSPQDNATNIHKIVHGTNNNTMTIDDVVTFDVRGRLFRETKSTLLKGEDNYFHAMLASGYWLPNEKGT